MNIVINTCHYIYKRRTLYMACLPKLRNNKRMGIYTDYQTHIKHALIKRNKRMQTINKHWHAAVVTLAGCGKIVSKKLKMMLGIYIFNYKIYIHTSFLITVLTTFSSSFSLWTHLLFKMLYTCAPSIWI